MKEAAEQYNPMDAVDLHRALGRFYDDNKSDRSIELRWLAQQVIALKGLAHDLGVNGISSFQAKYAMELAELRLAEIEAERAKIAKADYKLSEEAEQLKRKSVKAA